MNRWFCILLIASGSLAGFAPALAESYTPSRPAPESEPWRWSPVSELHGARMRWLAEARDGTIWAGTDSDTRRYDGSAWTTVPDSPAKEVLALRDSLRAASEWVIREGRIGRFDGGAWIPASRVPDGPWFSILQARDGTVYAGGEGCLLTYRDVFWKVHPLDHLPLAGPVIDLLETRDGTIYLAGRGEGVFRFDPTETRYRSFEGLRAVCQDTTGTTWFLSEDRGVVRKDSTGWTRYGVREGMIDTPVCIVIAHDQTVWAAGSHRGMAATCRKVGEKWVTETHRGIGSSLSACCMARDSSLWFGSRGVLRFRGGQWTSFPEVEVGIGEVTSLAATGDGIVWAGGREGLRSFDGSSWKPVAGPEELSGPITSLGVALDTRLWVGTLSYGALQQGDKTWRTHDSRTGLPGNTVTGISRIGWGTCLILDHPSACATADRPACATADRRRVVRYDGQSWTPALDESLGAQAQSLWVARDNAIWVNATEGGRWKTVRYQPDRNPPKVTLTLKNDPPTYTGNAALEWTGSDPGGNTPEEELRYSYRLDGGPWSPYLPQRGYLCLGLSRTTHSFEVKARDRDFNETPTPAIRHFTVTSGPWEAPGWLWIFLLLALSAVFLVRQVLKRDRGLTEFVSVVSHDLRTPLAGIRVHLDNLIDGIHGPLTEKQTRTLIIANGSLERLSRLIEDLLDLSRVESGRLRLHPSLFPMTDAAGEVVDHFQAVARDKGVTLVLGETTDVTLRADRDRVVQVLTNLVGNGVKFTPEGGRVEVTVERLKRKVRVCVSDTGPGIPPDQQDAIFERFHQIDKGGGGTGLGLSISRSLIRLQGGKLWVESRVGEGSRFYFTLPVG